MRSARAGAAGPAARLEAIGVAYVTFASSRSAHFRLLGAPELADLPAHPDLLAAYRDAFAVLVEAVEECQRAGVVRSAEPRKLAFAAWATVHGVAWLVVDGQLAIAAADSDAMRTLYRGLGAETRSATERRARRPRPRS
jgi:Tetracyclin repressor-like, C-terminal domain